MLRRAFWAQDPAVWRYSPSYPCPAYRREPHLTLEINPSDEYSESIQGATGSSAVLGAAMQLGRSGSAAWNEADNDPPQLAKSRPKPELVGVTAPIEISNRSVTSRGDKPYSMRGSTYRDLVAVATSQEKCRVGILVLRTVGDILASKGRRRKTTAAKREQQT